MSTDIELERVCCNICQNDRGETPLFLIDNPSLARRVHFSVVRCRGCGLVFVDPRPRPECLSQFYDESVVSNQLEVHEAGASRWRDSVVSRITKGIVNERIKSIGRLVRLGPELKLLDMGCGKGAFLFQLRSRFGGCLSGLELNPSCVQFCRETLALSVVNGSMEELNPSLKKQNFEVVTMWHSLEHSLDPLASISNASNYLSQEGLLVVEVPNEKSLENWIFRSKSFLYEVPVHLYDFDLHTLTLLLKKAQLEIVKVEYPIGAGGWFGSLQRLLTKDKAFKNMAQYLPFILTIGALVFPLEWILSFTKWGSVLRVYARKSESTLPGVKVQGALSS